MWVCHDMQRTRLHGVGQWKQLTQSRNSPSVPYRDTGMDFVLHAGVIDQSFSHPQHIFPCDSKRRMQRYVKSAHKANTVARANVSNEVRVAMWDT